MLKKLIQFLTSFIPFRLPTGMTEFTAWVDSIIKYSGLPDNVSTRRLAANFILQLRPDIGHISIREASNMLIKAASNQVSAEVLGLNEKSKRTTT